MRSYRPFTVLILLIAAGLMTACSSGPQEPYTTESGLTIQIMKAGRGKKVIKGQTVYLYYVLWLEDGTQVATNDPDRGGTDSILEVENIGDGQVVKGLNEGVVGMRIGEVRRLICPPDLAYGETGRSPLVPPNATLTFEVELDRIR